MFATFIHTKKCSLKFSYLPLLLNQIKSIPLQGSFLTCENPESKYYFFEDLDCDNLLVITWDRETEEIIRGKRIILEPLRKWLSGPIIKYH